MHRHLLTRRGLPALVAGLALGVAGTAQASTASVSGGTLTVTAAAGETNVFTLKRLPDAGDQQRILVRDSDGSRPADAPTFFGVPDPIIVLFGPGCEPGADVHEVICSSAAFTDAVVTMSDRDDYFSPATDAGALPPTTVNADGGSDYVQGTAGDDVLQGGSGSDQLFGNDGDDLLAPGIGQDEIFGGAGTDRAFYGERTRSVSLTLDGLTNDGEAGEKDFIAPDTEGLQGGSGDDVLLGTDAANALHGGAGSDTITGRGAADVITGGTGDDGVDAGAGNDWVDANAGNDTVDGGAGNDEVIGADGDNVLTGGDGDDKLTALGGADRIDAGEGTNLVTAGDGDNTVIAGGGADDITTGSGVDTITAGAGHDSIATGAGNDTIDTGAGNDDVTAGAGEDRLLGFDGNDALDGGADDDVLQGHGGADVLIGGQGVDTLSYEERVLAVFFSNGDPSGEAGENDTPAGIENVIGGAGDDRLYGGPEVNRLEGRAGNDELLGLGGADTLLGGDGDDDLQGGAAGDTILGGDGYDQVSYAGSAQGVTVTLGDGVANDGATGENDNLGTDIEKVQGSPHGDSLTGSDGRNDLLGMAGDDALAGLGGPDLLDGGDGTDSVSYADRATGVTITLDGVADDGEAGEGDNVLASLENITGSGGNDRIVAGAGPNLILAGGGDDSVDGGLGADDLRGEDGIDTVVYGGRGAGETVTVRLDDDANDGAPGEGDNVRPDVENLTGGDEVDDFRGSAKANVLTGGGGNDVLGGVQGADTLVGGDGDDQLEGGAGDDRLVPGLGADDVLGGPEVDTVDYTDHPVGVTVTFDNVADDGNAGEGDNVHDNVERALLPATAPDPDGDDAETPPTTSGGDQRVATGEQSAAAPVVVENTQTTGSSTTGTAVQTAGPVTAKATVLQTSLRSVRKGKTRSVLVSGRLEASGCPSGGTISVRVLKGGRVVGTRTAKVSRTCSFTAPVTLKRGTAGKLRVEVRFLGTRALRPSKRTGALTV